MNNVILDVVIGIIFIFLLYSLLATSIQEAIATGFSIRARMLRSGIINGMLSNTSTDTRWQSILKGISCFFQNIWYLVVHKPQPKKTGLGQLFYDHPLIKNYGSSRVFPNPSYLPTANFSTVLIDVLLTDFEQKSGIIAGQKAGSGSADSGKPQFDLSTASDAQKIQELLWFYANVYDQHSVGVTTSTPGAALFTSNSGGAGGSVAGAGLPGIPVGTVLHIEEDTLKILALHFRTSLNNLETFATRLQTWFDDSMDRVGGWYKRQVQVILFIIGLSLAILFNVDIIQISGKLSTDKDARDQLVKMAIDQADSYKDDPRVQKSLTAPGAPGPGVTPADSKKTDSADVIYKQYQQHITEAKNQVINSVTPANQVLALGWGDYGKSHDSARMLTRYFNHSEICNQRLPAEKSACRVRNSAQLDSVFGAHAYACKISYISSQFTTTKFAGILLTAFAISLGAPFWFDLLNKFMNLRASGKKEGKTANAKSGAPAKPLIVNIAAPPADDQISG